MINGITILAASALLLATGTLQSQEKKEDKKKWDVQNPEGPYKEVSFTVNEGTWMNLDVSPDGKEIVFDLLGDLYTLPVAGGQAKILRSGHAYDLQPRYSPDGKQILFTSDAGGGDNIWVMNRDGSNAKQVTKETFRLLNNPAWSPGGDYFVARKHFTSTRSLGAGEIWMYHISGGGGLQLTQKKNDQQDVNEPVISPDGRYVYFSEDMYPGGNFQYNKDPNDQIFAIRRFDREKGTVETVTGGPGGAVRPQLSRDGKLLSFIKRVRTKSVLYVRNLATGEEWPVFDKLSKDQQEAWTVFGSFTNYNWLPDNETIIIWSNGKINRININQPNQATNIPFTAQVKQKISDAVRTRQFLNHETFAPQVIRHATTSPDGKTLLFNAVGYLWTKQLPNGKPTRLTNGTDHEFEPSYSADGKWIVYVTWNDDETGAIYKVRADGGTPQRVTKEKGLYRTPSFSPDGNTIVFYKEGDNNAMGNTYTVRPGIYTFGEGEATFVSEKGEYPTFASSGDRIFYRTGGMLFGGPTKTLGSYNLKGNEDRTHIKSTYGSQFVISPDTRWIAFVDLHKVYVAAFPVTGRTIDLGSTTADFPVKLVSRDAGINLHWSADSKQLMYTLGDQYYSIKLEERFEFLAGIPDSTFVLPEKGITVGLQVKADKPTGVTAFTNARIITMQGNEVIENGTLVVEGNLVKAIGSNVAIPSGATVIDVAGKTIMPGMVDAHAHGAHFRYGLTPVKHWPYYANLAYGVTSMHDPSANSEMVFAQSELVKAGEMVGPRVFSTGTILYGAEGDFKAVINTIDDARSALRRSKAYGSFSVKSYNQPRRDQRQMIIKAARELGMEVVPEGGSFFFHNMTMILDGHTTIEHNIPIAPLYADVVNLWKNSKTAYTPTLIVNYGGLNGEYYWYQKTNVWEKERLLRFTPRSIIDPRSRHRTMVPDEEYENGHILISKSANKLASEGVTVNMGAHGQLQGLGAHWEVWMLGQGGMSNHEALRAATYNPAYSLGLDNWIGSLEPGKFADLIVMDKNPLEDLFNTESISQVMVNGRLYDAATMNEIGNRQKPRGKFWWEHSRTADLFNWHEHAEGNTDHTCCSR